MTYQPIPGTRIFAFGGPSRSGKDTAGRIIAEINPLNTRAYAFSDAISVHCRLNYGMTKRDPKMLQKIGFEARLINPAIWCDALYWVLDEHRPRTAVISGVRFPDELQMLRTMGAALTWVERVYGDGTPMVATDRDPKFPTETALARGDFDHALVNPDGDELTFRLRVLHLYQKLTHNL